MAQMDMTVEMVVQRLGVTPRTLHYYEELGLIPDVRRTAGGHRLYDEATVQRLERILRLKGMLGYRLQDIKQLICVEELLDKHRRSLHATPTPEERLAILDDSLHLLEDVVKNIDSKIEGLMHLRANYQERLQRVQQSLDGQK